MLTNCCPAATALPDTIAESCAQNFGQIQKIIFQRIWNGSSKNQMTETIPTPASSTTDAAVLAAWTALKTATGDDANKKITVTPFIEAPADDGGDARTFGGGNDTLNGVELIIGSNPVNFTCRMNGKKQNIVANLKALMCEALGNNLGVYLVNEKGQIEGLKVSDTVTSGSGTRVWQPIPIQKLFVGDKHHGNFDGPDYNELSFAFAPGYSDQLDVLTLDASALAL